MKIIGATTAGILGFLLLIGSLFANAILGSQVALLGIGVILLGILGEIQKLRKLNEKPVINIESFPKHLEGE